MKSKEKLESLWDSFYKNVGENLSEGTADDWVDRSFAITKRLELEIEILREYGNKDCTAMADVEIEKLWQVSDEQIVKEANEEALRHLQDM